jgi:hypothetical protein
MEEIGDLIKNMLLSIYANIVSGNRKEITIEIDDIDREIMENIWEKYYSKSMSFKRFLDIIYDISIQYERTPLQLSMIVEKVMTNNVRI